MLCSVAKTILKKNKMGRTSLVALWKGTCLPVQETQVQSLVWEDPTCSEAKVYYSHNSS